MPSTSFYVGCELPSARHQGVGRVGAASYRAQQTAPVECIFTSDPAIEVAGWEL
jgi:hypothetical protein